MKIGVYGDVHLTKNMKNLQATWDRTSVASLFSMYDKFDEVEVDRVVCLGDFFDAPKLEAKSMDLVLPILRMMNQREYPTYILLGNHEIDSEDSNVLEYLSIFDNIHPVTEVESTDIDNMLFIPYNVDPHVLEIPTNGIVFTHHDIYGSALASGKTKAFFGIDPSVFRDAGLVLNGHVHLKSVVAKNIINAGSLLVSQQGELKVGDYPSYYILDTYTLHLEEFENKNSMIYLSVEEKQFSDLAQYKNDKLVLRVNYDGEIPDVPINPLHVSYRKNIVSIGDKTEEIIHDTNFDMKNYLVEYLRRDQTISDKDREDYMKTGMEMLS